MIARPLTLDDFDDALLLYQILTRDPVPVTTDPAAFDAIVAHAGTTVFGMEHMGKIISMLTLHLLPNMTSGGRPYGLIENVVTDPDHRGSGMGRSVMEAAFDHARKQDAYKLMLMTGTARGALGFYEKMGFSGQEKYGLVMRF